MSERMKTILVAIAILLVYGFIGWLENGGWK